MLRRTYARLVNANRALLLRHYSYLSDGSASQAVVKLTQHAVAAGYIPKRPPPPGQTIREWTIKNSAPQWACRAAFDLLIDHGWEPETDTERAVSARYLLLNKHNVSIRWYQLLGKWLTVAEQANIEI